MKRLRRIFIGLGANLGDRLENLRKALDLLKEQGITVTRVSGLYESEPLGVAEPQPPYLNAVAEIVTDLPLDELLARLEAIERQLRRTQKGGWQPRTIDLDILWAEGERVQTERLTVPHPRLWERAFVLLPLAELTGALDGIPIAQQAEQVAKWQTVWRVCSAWYSAGNERRGD